MASNSTSFIRSGLLIALIVAAVRAVDWVWRTATGTYPYGLDADIPYHWRQWPLALIFASVYVIPAFVFGALGGATGGLRNVGRTSVLLAGTLAYSLVLLVDWDSRFVAPALILASPAAVGFVATKYFGRRLDDI